MSGFVLNGEEYPYFRHPANNTKVNERIVEVPIIRKHVEGKQGSTLEVGNVLGQYLGRRWTTVDLVEKEPGVTNCDILDWKGGPYDLIVSISTFEHIGVDHGTIPSRAIDAIQHCEKLLRPGGRFVFTIPIGYHPLLDSWLLETWHGKRSFLRRMSPDNRWAQVDEAQAKYAKYGKPYKYGNALIVGEIDAPSSR